MPIQLSKSVLWRYIAAEHLSGLVDTAQTESWSPRGTRIGLRIFALRSSAALFSHRYQSTANAQGRRHPIKAKGGKEKTGKSSESLIFYRISCWPGLAGLRTCELIRSAPDDPVRPLYLKIATENAYFALIHPLMKIAHRRIGNRLPKLNVSYFQGKPIIGSGGDRAIVLAETHANKQYIQNLHLSELSAPQRSEALSLSLEFLLAGLLATWFSSAQMASLERQTAKLSRNRVRIQKRHRNRDSYTR